MPQSPPRHSSHSIYRYLDVRSYHLVFAKTRMRGNSGALAWTDGGLYEVVLRHVVGNAFDLDKKRQTRWFRNRMLRAAYDLFNPVACTLLKCPDYTEAAAPRQIMDIQQVAKRAKVSTATVSRVLNGATNVREKTSAHVRSVIAEMNYVPNTHARSLRVGRARMFGLIVSDINNPFFPELIDAF